MSEGGLAAVSDQIYELIVMMRIEEEAGFVGRVQGIEGCALRPAALCVQCYITQGCQAGAVFV